MQTVNCPITREVDVYVAIGRARELANGLGFSDVERSRIEIVILELSRNILVHAGSGEVQIEPLQRQSQHGIAVTARDSGPGIGDIALALCDGYSTTHTLGAGLPGVRRLSDEFDIHSTPGNGTIVRAVTWSSPQRQLRWPRLDKRS